MWEKTEVRVVKASHLTFGLTTQVRLLSWAFIIMEKRKETRLTVVMDGRRLMEYFDVEIEEDIQDEGRTIKLFLKKNDEKTR